MLGKECWHRADFQIRAISQLPALVCIAGNISISLSAQTNFDVKQGEPGEPVAVGVELALALAAGEVLLVVKAEDVGLGEGAGRGSEPLAVAPLHHGEEEPGEEGNGDEKGGGGHGNLKRKSLRSSKVRLDEKN